jgi:hypothetical protein
MSCNMVFAKFLASAQPREFRLCTGVVSFHGHKGYHTVSQTARRRWSLRSSGTLAAA